MKPKIFKPKELPTSLIRRAHWDFTQGWAVILDGEILYGAYKKEDIKRYL